MLGRNLKVCLLALQAEINSTAGTDRSSLFLVLFRGCGSQFSVCKNRIACFIRNRLLSRILRIYYHGISIDKLEF